MTDPVSIPELEELVNTETGPHGPTWSFSGCNCGWTAQSDMGRRMPQYLAHVVQTILETHASIPDPCSCCDKPGPHPYQDRHGMIWCVWCHDNGVCTDLMGHKEEV